MAALVTVLEKAKFFGKQTEKYRYRCSLDSRIRHRKMDDVATAQSENENLRKIRNRLMQWESKTDPLAALSVQQEEHLDVLTNLWRGSGSTVREELS